MASNRCKTTNEIIQGIPKRLLNVGIELHAIMLNLRAKELRQQRHSPEESADCRTSQPRFPALP